MRQSRLAQTRLAQTRLGKAFAVSEDPDNDPRGWPRRLRQFVVFVLLCVVIASCGMVYGTWAHSRAIDGNMGQAVAEVRHVDAMRTAVDFVDETGEYYSPPRGLLIPVGLEEGQRVRVEYDRDDPNIVRVAGRSWTLALIPAFSVIAVAFLIAIPLWWWSLRRSTRQPNNPYVR